MPLRENPILSNYKLLTPLNEAHGVFLVQHTVSGRVFVMKRLTTFDTQVFARLKAKPIDGIPRIYETVEENGILTVVEQYIDGEPISAMLERQGPFTEKEAIDIARQLAVILSRLHEMDPPIIHREIKPSNVILSDNGSVTLIDLDAAKLHRSGATRDTELIGTLGYAAPEQFGFGASAPGTDIYALGRLLYVLLTGSLPNENDGYLNLPKSELIRPSLLRIIRKCTEMDADRRYSSAQDLLEALTAVEGKRTRTRSFELKGFSKYRPLGFRTLTPWKMLLGLLGYASIVFVVFLAEYPGVSAAKLFFVRAWSSLMLIAMVLFASNFCGVLDLLGINRIKKLAWKIVVIVIMEAILMFAMLIPITKYLNS